jgi:hypothetical protein
MTNLKNNKSTIVGIAALTLALALGGTAFASHSFEAGTVGNAIPDNTNVQLNGMTLPPGGVVPIYDASPNIVSGHFLYRGPCDEVTITHDEESWTNHVPKVAVIAGHIDVEATNTNVQIMPLFYISHASTAGSCVWHGHVPDPLNGGAPLVTDIDLINLSGADVIFKAGDVADMNVLRVLGEIGTSYVGNTNLPSDIVYDPHTYPVFDLNDESHDNDGAGHHD